MRLWKYGHGKRSGRFGTWMITGLHFPGWYSDRAGEERLDQGTVIDGGQVGERAARAHEPRLRMNWNHLL